MCRTMILLCVEACLRIDVFSVRRPCYECGGEASREKEFSCCLVVSLARHGRWFVLSELLRALAV